MASTTFEGKVAVVSGSTSGIGRATALRLASEGAVVVVHGRSPERAIALVGDIADPDVADRIVTHALDQHGRLDVVVNAAGVIHRGDAEHTPDAAWRLVLGTNLDGAFFLSRAALPALRAAGGGAIVNVSSTCGLVGSAGLAAYCAAKGAVTNLTRAMALDHAHEGIRINAVCPGAVDTPMLVSAHEPDVDPDAVRAANVEIIPQGRLGTDDDIASTIVFLASPAASHIVGAAISIDGGYTAQ